MEWWGVDVGVIGQQPGTESIEVELVAWCAFTGVSGPAMLEGELSVADGVASKTGWEGEANEVRCATVET
jgi:hypothetical protein